MEKCASCGSGRAAGRVVEAVMAEREIRRADRNAREAQAEPAIAAEQFLEQRCALRRVQPRLDEPGARVGDRCAEPDHRLIAPSRIDIDPSRERRLRAESQLRLARQQSALVGRRHPDLSAAGRGGVRPAASSSAHAASDRLSGLTCGCRAYMPLSFKGAARWLHRTARLLVASMSKRTSSSALSSRAS